MEENLIDLIGESNFLNQGEGEAVDSGKMLDEVELALEVRGSEERAERTAGEKKGLEFEEVESGEGEKGRLGFPPVRSDHNRIF